MQRRAFPRLKRRVNCDLYVGDRRHVGVAQELSPRGFFVQTAASPHVGSHVVIRLHQAGGDSVEVGVKVANRRRVPSRLAAVARGGVGCTLDRAPEAYYRLLAELSGPRP